MICHRRLHILISIEYNVLRSNPANVRDQAGEVAEIEDEVTDEPLGVQGRTGSALLHQAMRTHATTWAGGPAAARAAAGRLGVASNGDNVLHRRQLVFGIHAPAPNSHLELFLICTPTRKTISANDRRRRHAEGRLPVDT